MVRKKQYCTADMESVCVFEHMLKLLDLRVVSEGIICSVFFIKLLLALLFLSTLNPSSLWNTFFSKS